MFFTLRSILFTTSISAQTITGTINDPTEKPQEFATVMLMRVQDTALVKGAITDKDGRFELEKIAPGRYFTRVSMFDQNVLGWRRYSAFELYGLCRARLLGKLF